MNDNVAGQVCAWAGREPKRPAIADARGLTTYGELVARTARLARHLGSLGAGPDTLVAVILPRSADLVIGALASWWTGAAYAPMDPAAPHDRLTAMLDDARPHVIVTSRALAASLGDSPWPILALDDNAHIERQAEALPDPAPPAAHDLAYVIYTSGSTGTPKGVELTHGGLSNLVHWHRETFAVTADDRAPLTASPGFDASVWEMWPYLASGASLHVPDEFVRMDPVALRDWLVEQAISIAFVTTPLAERMLGLPWPAHTRLRTLLTGADTLHRRPTTGLPFTVVNNYGPTECTVVATSGVVTAGGEGLPSIGKAIRKTLVRILDEARQPVPDGTEGELWLGGAGVARGYRRQPQLTAERFVPDPFGAPDGRLYRTGDRARTLPDGSLAFCGRSDDQVKIRGHRVELDEIVAALNAHPMIAASAVIAAEGPADERGLIAYVVPRGTMPSPGDLVTALRDRLPEYMRPAAFVELGELPLTASGKVDRARLPKPDTAVVRSAPGFVAPATAVEQRLATMVAGLLGVPRVGLSDDFFLMGGHSLLGTQLIARVRDAFDVEIPLRTIFDHPTVGALAAQIEHAIFTRLEAA